MFDHVFSEFSFRVIYHIIYGTEVMHGLQNVIHGNPITYVDGVSLKYQTSLLFREPAAFDVIGVVRHPDLEFMIQTSGTMRLLFLLQHPEDLVVGDLSHQKGGRKVEIVGDLLNAPVRQFLALRYLCHCAGGKAKFPGEFGLADSFIF